YIFFHKERKMDLGHVFEEHNYSVNGISKRDVILKLTEEDKIDHVRYTELIKKFSETGEFETNLSASKQEMASESQRLSGRSVEYKPMFPGDSESSKEKNISLKEMKDIWSWLTLTDMEIGNEVRMNFNEFFP